MKTAVLVGYHGHKNLGDDIFRKILMNWLATVLKVTACSVSAKKHSIEQTIFGIKLSTFETPVKRVSRFLWLPIFFKSLKSDYLIFSAGSIFTIQPFFIMYVTIYFLKLIRGKSLSVMAVGVSIGPFKNNFARYWCLRSLSLMDQVLLRDKKSSDILKKSNLKIAYTLSYDLALSWYETFPELLSVRSNNSCLIGLSLTTRGFGVCAADEHSNICNSVISAIESVIQYNDKAELRIFSVCNDSTDGDLEICKHLAKRLIVSGFKAEIMIYDGNNVDEYLSLIYECSLMIASRMHAGILATGASIPVYQISYADKIKAFYEHCGLSTTYMHSVDNVNKHDIEEFLSQGLLFQLTDFADIQCRNIKQKGKIVYSDLMNLS